MERLYVESLDVEKRSRMEVEPCEEGVLNRDTRDSDDVVAAEP